VNLTPEDLKKLQARQVANIIQKLNRGKTLTTREEAILAQTRDAGEDGEVQAPRNPAISSS
jgi:hypothetical protein